MHDINGYTIHLTCFLIVLALVPTIFPDNTSLKASVFDQPDYSFASSDFVSVSSFNFTSSGTLSEHALLIAATLSKLSGGGSNNVIARLYLDDEMIMEQNLASLQSNTGMVMAGFLPVIFNATEGAHNISIMLARDGKGTIEISDMDIRLIRFVTAHNNPVNNMIINSGFEHSSVEFTESFNFTVIKKTESPTFFLFKSLIDSDSQTNAEYYFQNKESMINSSYWSGHVSANNGFRSVSGFFILDLEGNGSRNHTIYSRSTSGTVTNNISILLFDLADNESNTVNSFYASSILTNLTTSAELGPGLHNIINLSSSVLNGTGYLFGGYLSLSSLSGTQTVRVSINSTEKNQDECYSKKDIQLKGNLESSTVLLRSVCDNLILNDNYTFNLWIDVPDGKSVLLLDERLNGFEITRLETFNLELSPLPNEITYPQEGSNVSGLINISWTRFYDPGQSLVLYNLTIAYPNLTNFLTINSSTPYNSQLFNSSLLPDNDWLLIIEGCNENNFCSNTNQSFSSDNTKPILIVTSPSNGTVYDSIEVSLEFFSYDEKSVVNSCRYVLNNNPTVTLNNCENTTLTAIVGENTLRLSVNDSADNIKTVLVNFSVSLPAPVQDQRFSSGSGNAGSQSNYVCNMNECTRFVLGILKPGVPETLFFYNKPHSIASINLFAGIDIVNPGIKIINTLQEEEYELIPKETKHLSLGGFGIQFLNIYPNTLKELLVKFSVNKTLVTENKSLITIKLLSLETPTEQIDVKIHSIDNEFINYVAALKTPGYYFIMKSNQNIALTDNTNSPYLIREKLNPNCNYDTSDLDIDYPAYEDTRSTVLIELLILGLILFFIFLFARCTIKNWKHLSKIKFKKSRRVS